MSLSLPCIVATEMSGDSVSPGPGRYNAHAVDMRAVFKPATLPADSSGFGAAQPRFRAGANYTPGPVSSNDWFSTHTLMHSEVYR